MSTALVFSVVVLFAYSVQVAIGFGGTLLAISLGGVLLGDVSHLVTLLVPASLVSTGALVAARPREVRWELVMRSLLPLMIVGACVAEVARPVLDRFGALEALYAVFVGAVAVHELRAARVVSLRPRREPRRSVALSAGFVHGIYASGGPLVVVALTAAGLSKGEFRTTLCALWLIMNAGLTAAWLASGRVDAASLTESALLVPAMLGALVLGAFIHRRVHDGRFRVLVAWGLLASAALLIAH